MSAGRRRAGGLEFGASSNWRVRTGTAAAQIVGLQENGLELGLRMGPSGRRDGTVAIALAATRVTDFRLPIRGGQRIVALVNSFPQAAGMGRRDGNRER